MSTDRKMPRAPEKESVSLSSWKTDPRFNFIQMDPEEAANQIGRVTLSSIPKVAIVKGEKGCLRLPLKTNYEYFMGIAVHLETTDEYCLEVYFQSMMIESGKNVYKKYLCGLYGDQLSNYIYTYADLAVIKKIFAEEWKEHLKKSKIEKAMFALVVRMGKLQKSNPDAYNRLQVFMDSQRDKEDVDAVEKKLTELEKEKTEGRTKMLNSRFLNETSNNTVRDKMLKSSLLTEAKGSSFAEKLANEVRKKSRIETVKINGEDFTYLFSVPENSKDNFAISGEITNQSGDPSFTYLAKIKISGNNTEATATVGSGMLYKKIDGKQIKSKVPTQSFNGEYEINERSGMDFLNKISKEIKLFLEKQIKEISGVKEDRESRLNSRFLNEAVDETYICVNDRYCNDPDEFKSVKDFLKFCKSSFGETPDLTRKTTKKGVVYYNEHNEETLILKAIKESMDEGYGSGESRPKEVKLLIAKTLKALKYALENAEGDDQLVKDVKSVISEFEDIDPDSSLTILQNYVPDHDEETYGKDVWKVVAEIYTSGLEKIVDKVDKENASKRKK